MSTFHERLETLREKAGISPRALSLKIGKSESWYRKLQEKSTLPRADTLSALATALGVTTEDLMSEDGSAEAAALRIRTDNAAATRPQRDVSDPIAIPNPRDLPKDVPVLGTASGSVLGSKNGAMQLSDNAIDFVRRPPGLADTQGAYALFVENLSMSPRFEPGDLIYVHPTRPPRAGDYVIVQVQNRNDHDMEAYIKKLIRRSGTHVTCEQYNPEGQVDFLTSTVKALHRVMTTSELMGL